jgi:hypothetical protein
MQYSIVKNETTDYEIASAYFNPSEGEYGVDQLTLHVEWKKITKTEYSLVPVGDGVTVEDGDAGGGVDATEYVGGALGVGSEVMFSDKFGTWMGKDGKIRNQNWGGNGRTGGKFKFAGKIGKAFKNRWLGIWCLWNIFDIYGMAK